MTDTWENFTNEYYVKNNNYYPSFRTETEELTLSDCENDDQEQIMDTNDSESFVKMYASSCSDSSQEELDHCSEFEKLVMEFKSLKEM